MMLARGTVILVELDPALGHEQRGMRPCVVVSNPAVSSDQRFRLVCVIPVTGTPGEGILYPPLGPGSGGLTKRSFVLIDQIRSIDKRRVKRVYGQLAEEDLARIDEGLMAFLGIGGETSGDGSIPMQ